MNSLAYKIFLRFICPIKKEPFKYVANVFALIGAYYTACEIEYGVLKSEKLLEFFRSHLLLTIIGAIALSIVLRSEKAEFSTHLNGKDTSITLKLANILAIKNTAVVIPTNTTFDTTMTGEFISSASIQGQFQTKYFHSDFSKLDEQLACSLEKDFPSSFQLLPERIKTKQKRYPIGTVAEVIVNNHRFYFLAVADVNEKGKPINVTMKCITEALVGLWAYLSREGHTENVAIPAIGTGRAGLKDGTLEDVVHETIFSFSVSARDEFVAKNLVICIHPPTLSDSITSWDALCDYLRLQCKYAREEYKKQLSSPIIGKNVD